MTNDHSFNKQQYSKNYSQYLESNVDGGIGGGSTQSRVELFSRFVEKGSNVFEIGSGGGNEAVALENAGYDVTASDFVDEFVEIMKIKGINAVSFDANKDDVPKDMSAVYANAVFVHFSDKELESFLDRAKENLVKEKVVFLSVLKGVGSERSARGRGFERDFHYYTQDSLKEIFEKTNFEVLHLSEDEKGKWIQAVISCK